MKIIRVVDYLYKKVGAKERTVTVYDIEELEGSALERARQWVREGMEEWIGEGITDYLETILKEKGWENIKGPWWSLYSQGSGVSFEADVPDRVIQEAAGGKMAEYLQQGLVEAWGSVSTENSQYTHSGTMSAKVDGEWLGDEEDEPDDLFDLIEELEEEVLELAREQADELHRIAEDSHMADTSDDAVDEQAMANEYEFYEDGRPA